MILIVRQFRQRKGIITRIHTYISNRVYIYYSIQYVMINVICNEYLLITCLYTYYTLSIVYT